MFELLKAFYCFFCILPSVVDDVFVLFFVYLFNCVLELAHN